MPTVASSTEHTVTSALEDLRALLAFRAATVRRPRRLRAAVGILVALTVTSAVVPAFASGAADLDATGSAPYALGASDLAALLPAAYLGFLALAVVSAAASGGGRELVPRDQAVAWPVAPAVEHLGALLLAPLNIAWLVQAWVLLGTTAYVAGPGGLLPAQAVTGLWLLVATAVAQVVGWSVEAVRRRPHGMLVVRATALVAALGTALLAASGRLGPLLDALPTTRLADEVAGVDRWGWTWFATVAVLLVAAAGAVPLGVLPARRTLGRSPRDEARLETGSHPARPDAAGDLLALVRVDRAGIWRAVSLRRGIVLLAGLPGAIALTGGLEWELLTVLPGLVASGAALLFGVNAWCLDGRGALWRDALPVDPGTVFAARALVLVELLLVSSAATLALAALRAGMPTAGQLVALLCTWVVVAVQVVSLSMRWSVRRPYAVDLRSARATPAPPLVMVGYSARLALSTTLTGMLFAALAGAPDWRVPVVVAVPLLALSGWRLARVRSQWLDPVGRSVVVATVAS